MYLLWTYFHIFFKYTIVWSYNTAAATLTLYSFARVSYLDIWANVGTCSRTWGDHAVYEIIFKRKLPPHGFLNIIFGTIFTSCSPIAHKYAIATIMTCLLTYMCYFVHIISVIYALTHYLFALMHSHFLHMCGVRYSFARVCVSPVHKN